MEIQTYCIALTLFFVIKYNLVPLLDHVPEHEYYKLPLLHEHENYDRCPPDAVYCIASFFLDIPEDSELYPILKKTEDKWALNHANVIRGRCLTYKNSSTGCVIDPTLPMEKSFERCVQKSVKEEYGVNINYHMGECHKMDITYPKDIYYYCYILLILTTLCLNVFATIYDGATNGNSKNFVVNSFSLHRNWRRLTQPDNNSHKCFNGLKAMNSQVVVLVHCLGSLSLSGFASTKNMEYYWWSPDFGINTNASVVMQSFFMISCFLRTEKTFKEVKKENATYKMVLRAAVDRYFRIMPLLFIGAAFWMTIFPHLGDGPSWHIVIGAECHLCRNAWYHILTFTNYLNFCQGYTWYLSTDFVLYILVTYVSIYLVKHEEHCLRSIVRMFLGSLVALFAWNYYLELPPVSNAFSMKFNTPWANDIVVKTIFAYVTPFGTIPTAFFGMMWYCLFRKYQDCREKLKNNTIFLTASRIALFWAPWYAILIYMTMPPHDTVPPVLLSLIATLDRLGYAVLTALYLTACMLNIDESQPWFRILNWRGWTFVSRLGLSSMMCHMAVVFMYASTRIYPETFTLFRFIAMTSGLLVVNLAIATVVHLMIELPSVQLYKALTSSSSHNQNSSLDRSEDSKTGREATKIKST